MAPTSKFFLSLTVGAILLVGLAPGSNGDSLLSTSSLIAEPHIINGVDTKIEDIPYQISLETLRIHSCGGAIISDNWVVTAAHCVHQQLSGRTNKRIRAGSTTEIPIIGWGGWIHQIDFIDSHKAFSLEKLEYDVAVIRVVKKFEFGTKIKPIIIPGVLEKDYLDYSKNVTVSGYGVTKVGSIIPSFHLKSAQIPLIPRDKCQALIPTDKVRVNITSRMICAGGTGEHGSDVNKGDSGGPMVQMGGLVGLTSWGLRALNPNLPSVFTNLLDPEIRSYVRENAKV